MAASKYTRAKSMSEMQKSILECSEKKEERMIDEYKIQSLAQLIEAIYESELKLEDADKKKDIELMSTAKKEILKFKGEMDSILK